jgi:hypothetical protein
MSTPAGAEQKAQLDRIRRFVGRLSEDYHISGMSDGANGDRLRLAPQTAEALREAVDSTFMEYENAVHNADNARMLEREAEERHETALAALRESTT